MARFRPQPALWEYFRETASHGHRNSFLPIHLDQGLHRLVPGGHGLKVGGKSGKRDARVDEVRGGDDARLNALEGFPDGFGGVVEGGEQR